MGRRGHRDRQVPGEMRRSISYLTCTLSAARKNPAELNSGAVTASARGCNSPARSSAASRSASLTVTTSATQW